MSTKQPIASALNIMRRMPPSNIVDNLNGLIDIRPPLTDELLQRVDQPLLATRDLVNTQDYLLCDYNRDGDSYRSPWTNEYYPAIENGFKPSPALRSIEQRCNVVFDNYRGLYYEGGVSSVYLWDSEVPGGFAGSFMIKKEVKGPQRHVSEGCWDSIHVIEAVPSNGATLSKGSYTYKLTTTVILSMKTKSGNAGPVNLSGTLTRQARSQNVNSDESDHVINIGKMIEEMEIDMRNAMDSLYIQKTREIISSIRTPISTRVDDAPLHAVLHDLGSKLKGRSEKKEP